MQLAAFARTLLVVWLHRMPRQPSELGAPRAVRTGRQPREQLRRLAPAEWAGLVIRYQSCHTQALPGCNGEQRAVRHT